jgi:hypothetical protein
MNSRAFVPACLWLIAVSGAALAEPRRQKLVPWEKFDEEDGVVLFRREVPGSGIVALRGEGLVDASLLRVGSVLLDTSRSTEWIEGLAETRIVRRISRTEHVQWDHFSGTMGLLDRDFVFKVKLELKPRDKQVVLSFHSVKDSAAPKTPYVRGDVYGSYVLTPMAGGGRASRRRCSAIRRARSRSGSRTFVRGAGRTRPSRTSGGRCKSPGSKTAESSSRSSSGSGSSTLIPVAIDELHHDRAVIAQARVEQARVAVERLAAELGAHSRDPDSGVFGELLRRGRHGHVIEG